MHAVSRSHPCPRALPLVRPCDPLCAASAAHGGDRTIVPTRTIVVTSFTQDEMVLQALRAGAQGYLLKDMDPEDLVPALQDAMRGNNVVAKELIGSLTRLVQGQSGNNMAKPSSTDLLGELTPRELEILKHVAEGQSNKAIGRALEITDGTVKLHVKSILRKLGVRSRVEAAVLAVEHGLGRQTEVRN